tara:strand:- start:54 stop:416 length:363 start_codon:yes stop_codon:yes gene_type:complete
MAVKWTVTSLDYKESMDGKNNVVTCVNWIASDSRDVEVDGKTITCSYSNTGKEILDISDLSDFTEYDNLTEEKCIEWVQVKLKAQYGDAHIQEIEDQIEAIIEQKVSALENQPRSGKPWE